MESRTLKVLFKKAFANPFLPLLFLSEFIKILTLSGLTSNAMKMFVLTIISSVVWVLSDAVEVDVNVDKIIG